MEPSERAPGAAGEQPAAGYRVVRLEPRAADEDEGGGEGGNTAVTEAEIWLYGYIGSWGDITVTQFRRDLKALGNVDVLHLHIHSGGGSAFDGFAMYSMLAEHKARKIGHVDGLAASAASYIPMACDEVVISPVGMFMIHEAMACACGRAGDLRATAELLDKLNPAIRQLYTQFGVSLSEAELAAAMEAETWYNADEALEAGFANRKAEKAVSLPTNAFDPSLLASLGISRIPDAAARLWAPTTAASAPPPPARPPLPLVDQVRAHLDSQRRTASPKHAPTSDTITAVRKALGF